MGRILKSARRRRSRFSLCNGSACLRNAAVKVQKSNHHHWDQSSNYCHPPHASHGKTWSSPSHPHNQQDHCKCKLSLMTALLLARHHRSSLFVFFFSTFVKSFPRGLLQHPYHIPLLGCMFPWVHAAAVDMAEMSCLKCFALMVSAFWYV